MYTEKKDKVAAIFSYFGWIFILIAFILRNRYDALSKHHLNQGLVLSIIASIASLLTRLRGLFAVAGEIVDLGVLVLSIMGIVRAAKESDAPLPLIGGLKLL